MVHPVLFVKRLTRRLLRKTTFGYLFYLRWDNGHLGKATPPDAPWHNQVLRYSCEVDSAVEQVRRASLPLNQDRPKNWDSIAAIDCVLKNTSRDSHILDAGSELYSTILPWLALLGYRNLVGINLAFRNRLKLGPISYEPGDITATHFGDNEFDAVCCMSVVEHGVNLTDYFTEMFRILNPGGILITSTDYWHESIDTGGKEMYGVPVYIFDRSAIKKALEMARQAGFEVCEDIDLSCREKAVHWKQVDLDYTFIIFTVRKPGQ